MLDYRIYTFLSLCETGSYTQTALELKMTQPGVTQHIQLLEREYGCRLFHYAGRTLSLTEEGHALAQPLRAAVSAQRELRGRLAAPPTRPLRIGATKTIGDFYVENAVCALASDKQYRLTVQVDNTDILLHRLDQFEIDLALIEGFFDKTKYAHRPLRREKFIGICAPDHPFAGRQIPIASIFSEHLILREVGSGTRSLLERILQAHNYTTTAFSRESCVNSFALIKALVRKNVGISFVYESVMRGETALSTFTLQGEPCYGEFNCVYLPSHSNAPWFLTALEQAISVDSSSVHEIFMHF